MLTSLQRQLSRTSLRFTQAAAITFMGFVGLSCSSDAEPEPPYGSIRIFLKAGEHCEFGDCFKGTKEIVVVASYGPCVLKFYDGAHASERFDDKGATIRDEWEGRLCAATDPSDPEEVPSGFVKCEIGKQETALQQVKNPTNGLRIEYNVKDDKLSGKSLRVGPIPMPDYAECEEDARPHLVLGASNTVIGFDKDGKSLWKLESHDPSDARQYPDESSQFTAIIAGVVRNESP